MPAWIRYVLFLPACLLLVDLLAQTAPDTYWIRFTDKANTPYSLSQPEAFLSSRAIARRAAQGVIYEENDLPVDPAYIGAVLATGDVGLLNRSKWFNGITIRTADPVALAAIQDLPFVQSLRVTGSSLAPPTERNKFNVPAPGADRDGEEERFGPSFLQINMLNGLALHALEAKGEGMLIGVLDSGFDGVDSALAFAPLRARGGIVLTRDLVRQDGDVFQGHAHGRSVLSCMAGDLYGQLYGTAPNADYILLRTEDADTEYPVEEDNWVAGAELADSLGCDVLNTSLGYTTFDDSTMDHSYADMDGQTLRISIAANIATKKGMIPVCSAGNQGSGDWYYISAPADAIDILTVGAVGDVENYAPFSSHGPSADGRIKPDVCTMGWGSIVLRSDVDSVVAANGTSFSAPILTGLVACLWQLHPERTAGQIMDAVRRSASFFNAPSDSLGYGVPDFGLAHTWLETTAGLPAMRDEGSLLVFPMPFRDSFAVTLPTGIDGRTNIVLYDASGRTVHSSSVLSGNVIAVKGLSIVPGPYVLELSHGDRGWRQRIISVP